MLRTIIILGIFAGFFINYLRCEVLFLQYFKNDARYISYEDLSGDVAVFTDSGVTSFAQVLFDAEKGQLFVGARDNIYRLSLEKLKVLDKSSWLPSNESLKMCMIKGQSENDCHNYIKVLLSHGKKLFVCGTYAFSPKCSWRELENLGNEIKSVPGPGKCPYNPRANVTALLTSAGQYYAGSATDFSESDPAIYRDSVDIDYTLLSYDPTIKGGGEAIQATLFGHPSWLVPNEDIIFNNSSLSSTANPANRTKIIISIENSTKHLRTNQYDRQWLNGPQFVGSFEDDSFVYFVFREIALEYSKIEKKIYSRIARVCKNDLGSRIMKDTWSTFVKARLVCSVQGEHPFFYDEIQGMHFVPEKQILYATFTTPSNAISGSAICAFNMSSIEKAFLGPFKYQSPETGVWVSHNVEDKSYAQCYKGSTGLSNKYQSMDMEIQPTTVKPLHTTVLERYSQIAVAIVTVKLFETYLIFVANDAGLIKKISIIPQNDISCLIEIWEPISSNGDLSIKTMKYLSNTKSLYIGTDTSVIKIVIANCHRYTTQSRCLGAQDPLCGWIERLNKCVQVPLDDKDDFKQNPPACPQTNIPLNGGWSSWSTWSDCRQSNGSIIFDDTSINDTQDTCRCQMRECNKPPPRNGGKACEGIAMNIANCTVHGGWTAWSSWSACSKSCGNATKFRMRTCEASKPANDGRLCVGPDRDETYCTENPRCPEKSTDYIEKQYEIPQAPPVIKSYMPKTPSQISTSSLEFSTWGPWDNCSVECGGGYQTSTRKCLQEQCEKSENMRQQACNTHSCCGISSNALKIYMILNVIFTTSTIIISILCIKKCRKKTSYIAERTYIYIRRP